MSPYQGSSEVMMNKCPSRRSPFIGGSGTPVGNSEMSSARDKTFLLLGVKNSRSNY